MKRILLIISILLIAISASGMMLIGGKPGGCTIPGSPDVNYEDGAATNTLTADAEGQSFDSGTGGTLARICVEMDHASDGTIDMRFDDDVDMSDGDGYLEDLGTSALITADGTWVCFDSATHPVLAASTTYYIGITENSGELFWVHAASDAYADGGNLAVSSGWTMSYSGGWDENFRVYYCD